MIYLELLLLYFFIGAVWTTLMEWYTTTYLKGFWGRAWVNSERWFHCYAWPYSFGIWLITLIKHWMGPWN